MVVKIRRMRIKKKKDDPEWLKERHEKRQAKFERREVRREQTLGLPCLGDVWPDKS